MVVNDSLMAHIKKQIESLDYGEVIIEIIGTKNTIDVITKSRDRFDVSEDKRKAGE